MRGSSRITGLNGGGSDGWDLFREAKRLKAAGEPVQELNIGEHDIRTDPVILDAMDRAAKGGHTGYPAIPGTNALRDLVAARITERTGVPTTRDNVLITPGGQAGLFSSHVAALDPGDTGLMIDPYYATYPGTIRAASAIPRIVQAEAGAGFQPDAARIAAAADGARSLLINTPNNPTGAVYTRDTLDGIARVVKDHDLWLISDEVYDTQVWDGTHLSPRALPGMEAHTLVVGSMSKSHAMTGSRIGWVIGPGHMIEAMTDLATSITYGVAGFVQDAAHYALTLGPEFESRVAAPFRRRRDMLMALLEKQQVLKSVPAEGAMYAMLDVRGTGMDGEAFGTRLLQEERIAVMPGASFGKAAAGHIRVALTLPDDQFAEAASRMIALAGRLAADADR